MAIKGAKSIAEYAMRKWLKEEELELAFFTLEINGNEGKLTDAMGNSITLTYDPSEKLVYSN